jgi:hypothetical protein
MSTSSYATQSQPIPEPPNRGTAAAQGATGSAEACAWCEAEATQAFKNGWDGDAEMVLCSSCALELIPDDVRNDRPPTVAELAGTWPTFDSADELAAFEEVA